MIKVMRTLLRGVKRFSCALVFFGSLWTPFYVQTTYGRGWWTEPLLVTCIITLVGSILLMFFYGFDD